MKVTINSLNRALDKERKAAFALHISKDLKSQNKQNSCFSNQLKFKFQAFEHQHENIQLTLSQRRNMKQFKLLKQKGKISATKKIKEQITHYIPGKLLYAQSLTNKTQNHNNPQILYEDQLISSVNQLKMCKIEESNHSTKANSREKSRANSMESSTNCCKIVRTQKEEAFIKIVEREPVQYPNGLKGKKKQLKISKIMSPQITKTTRTIMLDWLFQLSVQIELPKQALYNAIDYVDKYVTQSEVKKANYQQLGLSCLFLATKLQMSSHPHIQSFLEAMDNQLDKNILIETERKIVNTLKFRLNPPTLFQYMTLALLTLKTFKNEYKNIGWLNDLPEVEKDDSLWRRVFWILDGVTMQGVMVHKYGKSDICLGILYAAILTAFQERFIMLSKQSAYGDHLKLESTVHSQMDFTTYERPFRGSSQEQRIRLSYECYFRYATISNRSLHDLDYCLDDLKKWKNQRCHCDKGFEYHEELKHISLSK